MVQSALQRVKACLLEQCSTGISDILQFILRII
jgi:hypothetical protein